MTEARIKTFSHEKFEDSRGWLSNVNASDFCVDGPERFVHSFISYSKKNTVRGFHFQQDPYVQEKIIFVLQGVILDVSFEVALPREKPSFFEMQLGDECEHNAIWLSEAMAHGFMVVSSDATLLYLNSARYCENSARVINPICPSLDYRWPIKTSDLVISQRDLSGLSFIDYFRENKSV